MSVKSVLVTGSTSGIGLSVATCLAKSFPGANTMLNGFGTKEEIDNALATVSAVSQGGRVAYSPADLTKQTEVEKLIHTTVEEFGHIDVLVNNAGIQHVSPVEKFDPVMWDKVLALNLSAVFHATRLVLPGMKERNFGRIINVASVHGLQASPCKSAYVAAKHGVIGFTKTVALEVATTGVTCNAVCPGWVITPLVERQIQARCAKSGLSFEEEMAALVGEKMPSRRPAHPDELGNACSYLANPATASTNGAALNIDGGWMAGTVSASERSKL